MLRDRFRSLFVRGRNTVTLRKTEAEGSFSAYADEARVIYTDEAFEDGFEAP